MCISSNSGSQNCDCLQILTISLSFLWIMCYYSYME
nr:MAG TPA: hypothetical protein [Caudoviricetes sp.]